MPTRCQPWPNGAGSLSEMLSFLRPVWQYRGFILSSVKREFRGRYLNSLLGGVWAVLNPLAMILVYTVIFSRVMGAKLPGVATSYAYSVYLCAGVLTWGLFNEIVGRSLTVFIDNANIIKKIAFPRLCLPAIVVANAVVNFAIIFGLFLAFLLVSGQFPGWVSLELLPLLVIEILFAIGLGVTLGVLNVFFRDVGHFFGVFVQFWFWLTPIVYPIDIIPAALRPLIELNPMTQVVMGFQSILVYNKSLDWLALLPTMLLTLVFLGLGLFLFRRLSGDLVDEL